jgi:hypothetical protein
MRTIYAPKRITKNSVQEFLRKFEFTLSWKDKLVANIQINLNSVVEVDILGLLIIYKYIDFTYHNNCFRKPELITNSYIDSSWTKYEFDKLILAYVSNKDVTEKAFKEFRIKFDGKFIIAPQALLRTGNYTKDYLENEFIPKLSNYYNDDIKVTDLIFSCFSEILLNFWEHAVADTKSVIMADGNKEKIEIACADTGIGIISNLSNQFNDINLSELLSLSVEKGVTSKPNSNHMGFGLWLVNELISLNYGRLHLYSQGYYYYNDFGRISKGKCPYWPGTIIYINLYLSNPKTISDLIPNDFSKELKIKFT